MTLSRPWLPANAIERGVADLPLCTVVRSWSSTWFVGNSVNLAGDPIRTAPKHSTSSPAWLLGDGLIIEAEDRAHTVLATLLYGSVPGCEALTPADLSALNTAADTCLFDFRKQLSEMVGSNQAWNSYVGKRSPGVWWEFRISVENGLLLRVSVSETLIARRVSAALPLVQPRISPQPLKDAIDPISIAVSARVGKARLTTAELAVLGVGDLLVLDTALTGAARLAVEQCAQPIDCLIDQVGESLRLIIL